MSLSNLQESIDNDSQKLAKLDSIRDRIESIQKPIAVQITDSDPERERLLRGCLKSKDRTP